MSLDKIKQTNRTLLFEEFNGEKDTLLALISAYNSPEELKQVINERLLVGSFEEFLDKFTPTIYSYFDATKRETVYTLNKPEERIIPSQYITATVFTKHDPVLQMIIRMFDARETMGQKLINFDFQKITTMLTPRSIMEDMKMVRKELETLHRRYAELDDANPIKDDVAQSFNEKFERVREMYSSPANLLPLAIEDTKQRLLVGVTQKQSESVQNILVGYTRFEDDGSIKLIEHNPQLALTEGKEPAALAEMIENDYDDMVTENRSEFQKSLISRTFAPNAVSKFSLSREQEIRNYTQYAEMYKKDKENYFNAALELIKKIIGVKLFFDQGKVENNRVSPKLLITNNTLEQCCKKKEDIAKYLENTNNIVGAFENAIWFAIIPNVAFEAPKKAPVKGPLAVKNKAASTNPDGLQPNTLENLAEIMELMERFQIQAFFNFTADENTTFDSIAQTGIGRYKEKTQDLSSKKYSKYLSVCLPNFTILPKNNSGIPLTDKVNKEGTGLAKGEMDKIVLQGIYIDAAYVAAGIVAAYQSPQYLKKKFRRVNDQNPGVRFNIEVNNNNLKLPTTLAKEIDGFTNKILDEINQENFGFVFSSNTYYDANVLIKNIVVYKARSLYRKQNSFQPISEITVVTYFNRILYAVTGKQKKLIDLFFSSKGLMEAWKTEQADNYENPILQKEDRVSHKFDDASQKCLLTFDFEGTSEYFELEISD